MMDQGFTIYTINHSLNVPFIRKFCIKTLFSFNPFCQLEFKMSLLFKKYSDVSQISKNYVCANTKSSNIIMKIVLHRN